MGKDKKSILLSENSYSAIVGDIFKKIESAKAETLKGTEFLNEIYKNLNESSTPILELKQFVTGAEKISGDDVTIKDIINFCRKKVENGDLNFIINLVKEEHFSEMQRFGHPAPKETIKEIKEYFDKPSSEIEAGIRAGIFDGLQSKLLNKIKSDLNIDIKKVDTKTPTKLNESYSSTIINSDPNFISYNPIGVKFEDISKNKVVLMFENSIVEFNRNTNNYTVVDKKSINIPDAYNKINNALNHTSFDPEKNIFTLNENWDFSLTLNPKTSIVNINGKPIPKEKVKQLLVESINHYSISTGNNINFNKNTYLNDADSFITLMENCEHLIKFDTLKTIRNINENSFITYVIENAHKTNEPSIIVSSDNEIKNKMFESYTEFISISNKIINGSLNNMFESQLNNEIKMLQEKNSNIISLNESISELNTKITEVDSLLKIAEKESPAFNKLNDQRKKLDVKLNESLDTLNFYMNNFKLI